MQRSFQISIHTFNLHIPRLTQKKIENPVNPLFITDSLKASDTKGRLTVSSLTLNKSWSITFSLIKAYFSNTIIRFPSGKVLYSDSSKQRLYKLGL